MARSCSVSPARPTLPPDLGIRHAIRRTLDLLLPPRCAACDNPVQSQGQLCGACFGNTQFITPPFCGRCGVPFTSMEQGGADGLCPSCQGHPPVFRQARAALRYDDQARRLILPLKHGDRIELAAILAPMMARAGAALLDRADLLVPVPLHRRRLFKRKYNQAAILAFAVGRLAHRPVQPDALCRTRRTAPLDDKSPEERAQEVAGAIEVRAARQSKLVGRTILLIDDVVTSGATSNACAAALLTVGAAAVDVLAAARVPDPRLR